MLLILISYDKNYLIIYTAFMLYQFGIILIFVVAALIIAKKINNKKNNNLIYEDEMDEDELKKIDEELD
ncbi:MAG: hypothetical protein CMD46_01490 [Gammaproteobacteria bacterium]|nr:hypothetical protein [Gammaproteobacteria bacterium]